MLEKKTSYKQAQLAALIPHQPPMLLVDTVTDVDEHKLTATFCCHQQPHPLAPEGHWPNYLLIEFAAQAIACHGALAGQQSFTRAAIGRIKALSFYCASLDDYRELPVSVTVELIEVNGATCLYRFNAHARNTVLAQGEALLIGVPAS